MFHQEVDAMLLQRDRIWIRLGHAMDDTDVFDVELISSRCALVGTDLAGDDDARLLRETFERLEDFRRNALHMGDTLHGPGSVAEDREQQLSALARVVE